MIGLILAMYSVGMIVQSFTMDPLHEKLGTKKTQLLGVSSGLIVTLLAIAMNYSSLVPFVICSCLLRFLDGTRETQFEVTAFVYFA